MAKKIKKETEEEALFVTQREFNIKAYESIIDYLEFEIKDLKSMHTGLQAEGKLEDPYYQTIDMCYSKFVDRLTKRIYFFKNKIIKEMKGEVETKKV